jgi:hypothetical protein
MATGTTQTTANLSTTGSKIIPLEPTPRYSFQVTLEEKVYVFSIHWNNTDLGWFLDILGVTNTEDIKGIKLVTGPNLIKPYAIIDLGALYMIDVTGANEDPDFDNFGSRYLMMYIPTTNPDDII